MKQLRASDGSGILGWSAGAEHVQRHPRYSGQRGDIRATCGEVAGAQKINHKKNPHEAGFSLLY